jgi:hypothetical protein
MGGPKATGWASVLCRGLAGHCGNGLQCGLKEYCTFAFFLGIIKIEVRFKFGLDLNSVQIW